MLSLIYIIYIHVHIYIKYMNIYFPFMGIFYLSQQILMVSSALWRPQQRSLHHYAKQQFKRHSNTSSLSPLKYKKWHSYPFETEPAGQNEGGGIKILQHRWTVKVLSCIPSLLRNATPSARQIKKVKTEIRKHELEVGGWPQGNCVNHLYN